MAKREYKAIPEYYDPEYAHLEYLQRDVPFVMERLGRGPKKILELAVGTGRAAIPLAQAGHRVVGVDYDAGVLAIAERKRGFVGLTPRELELRVGDMRTVALRQRFDAVLLLFNTFLTLTTTAAQLEVMGVCRRHLVRGGRLFLDVFNPDLSLIAERQSYGLDPVTFHVPGLDGEAGRTVSRTADLEDVASEDGASEEGQVRRVTFHYRWFQQGTERYKRVAFEMTWMLPREMRLLLETAGFEVEEMAGDYDGSPVEAGSGRIIVVARKR